MRSSFCLAIDDQESIGFEFNGGLLLFLEFEVNVIEISKHVSDFWGKLLIWILYVQKEEKVDFEVEFKPEHLLILIELYVFYYKEKVF